MVFLIKILFKPIVIDMYLIFNTNKITNALHLSFKEEMDVNLKSNAEYRIPIPSVNVHNHLKFRLNINYYVK